MGNTFGRLFRVTTFGESHGPALGCVIDGCPPRLPLAAEEIQRELDRRRPGQSDLTTPRLEGDRVEILSGVFEGRTLGTPIALVVPSRDQRSGDYDHLRDAYRPSHADFTYDARYGIRDWRGGGRSSARETAARVAAGAVAGVVLRELSGVEVTGWVAQVHTVTAQVDPAGVTAAAVDATPVRCPDPAAAARMEAAIRSAKEAGDSVGGVVEAVARGVPAGLGAPVFDRLEAELAHALLSIPATKGFEIGSGFAAAALHGSEHNDAFVRAPDGRVTTATNRSGGVQGGISNGAPIVVRVAFKPPATIAREQATVTTAGAETVLAAKGRHDPCVLPRAVPIVEAMIRLVLADHLLRWRGQCGALPPR
jgi:chorismate synthase